MTFNCRYGLYQKFSFNALYILLGIITVGQDIDFATLGHW